MGAQHRAMNIHESEQTTTTNGIKNNFLHTDAPARPRLRQLSGQLVIYVRVRDLQGSQSQPSQVLVCNLSLLEHCTASLAHALIYLRTGPALDIVMLSWRSRQVNSTVS